MISAESCALNFGAGTPKFNINKSCSLFGKKSRCWCQHRLNKSLGNLFKDFVVGVELLWKLVDEILIHHLNFGEPEFAPSVVAELIRIEPILSSPAKDVNG